jgi:hypothetical protein
VIRVVVVTAYVWVAVTVPADVDGRITGRVVLAVAVAVTVGETVGVEALATGDIRGVPAGTVIVGLGPAVVVAGGVGDGTGGPTVQPAARTAINRAAMTAARRQGRMTIGTLQRQMKLADGSATGAATATDEALRGLTDAGGERQISIAETFNGSGTNL